MNSSSNKRELLKGDSTDTSIKQEEVNDTTVDGLNVPTLETVKHNRAYRRGEKRRNRIESRKMKLKILKGW
jgi:hypothetical protein